MKFYYIELPAGSRKIEILSFWIILLFYFYYYSFYLFIIYLYIIYYLFLFILLLLFLLFYFILLQKKIETIYPILSLFHSKYTSIFSNNYFSIHSTPSSIILNIFLSLFQSKFTSIFFNLPFFYPILFYIYQRQSFSISFLILIHVDLLRSPLFYHILSFIYQRQSSSIFLPI